MIKSEAIKSLNTEELFAEINTATDDLLQTISAFTHEQFNTVPFEGSWTAGQVCDHLHQSQSGLPGLMRGNKKPADRKPDEQIETIKSIFLDFSTKLKSPDFLIPAEGTKEKDFFLRRFDEIRNELKDFQHSDLTQLLIDFPFPQVGTLTAYEWLFFSVCHAKRHTNQLKNIYAAVSKKATV